MDISDITGVVLAGGTNSRFGGKIKANETIGGEKIISSILRVIRPIFGEIVIVTNTPEAFADITGCIITGDHFLKRGPLGGIHAAMKASSKDAVFVFAGDMPFLNSELILSQVQNFVSNPADVVIPALKGNIEPLHSIYSTNLVHRLEDFLTKGTDNMIRAFLNELSVRYFNVSETEFNTRSFSNINTPEDVAVLNGNVDKAFKPPRHDTPCMTPLLVQGGESYGSRYHNFLLLREEEYPGRSARGRRCTFSTATMVSDLSGILKKYKPDKENLLSILHDIQNSNPEQFISEDVMQSVAEYLNITLSSVYGVVTYYSMFSREPRGKYILRVCSSPVCEMTGSEGIIGELERKLGIGSGQTTPDSLFTIETCECLGHCEEAPGMIINDRFYGNLSSVEIDKIIDILKTAGE